MKRFYLSGVFFLSMFLLDFAIGLIVRDLLPELKVGSLGVVNNALRDSSQVLILGSSRALHHYDARAIENALGLSCYNGGLGGHGLLYSYAVLGERTLQNRPKIVILDISPNVLVDPKALDKLTVFLPLAESSKYFDEIVRLNTAIGPISMHVNAVRYNSVLHDLVIDRFVTSTSHKGFMPLTGSLNLNTYRPVFGDRFASNWFNDLYLRRIIETCRSNELMVFMVISPSYDDFDSSGKCKRYLADFAAENSIPFFDYTGEEAFPKKTELFKDQLHLNAKGAALFSEMLASTLKEFFCTTTAK